MNERRATAAPRARLGFIAATLSLIAIFAASGSPIPLYERYRTEDGLTTTDLSIAAVSYFAAVMISLVVFGRLSDHLGRRTVALLGVCLAAVSCLALLQVDSLGVLIVGRALQGLACGLGSSSVAAYVLDLAPARPPWLAATVTAGSPLIGLTVGALGAGALAEYGPAPEQSPYYAMTVFLALCVVLLSFSPEPVQRRPGAFASLRPRVAVPRSIRPLLPAAIAVFVSTWALGGFYQAFSPTISAQNLGTPNTLVAATVFASFMAPYALGGPLTGRFTPLTAQRIGILMFAAAVVGVVTGFFIGNVIVVILCGVLAGIAQGAAFTGTIRALLQRITLGERAGVMSTVYLFSYGGAAIPSFIAGRLAMRLSLAPISLGYAVLAVIASVIVLVVSRPGRTRTITQ